MRQLEAAVSLLRDLIRSFSAMMDDKGVDIKAATSLLTQPTRTKRLLKSSFDFFWLLFSLSVVRHSRELARAHSASFIFFFNKQVTMALRSACSSAARLAAPRINAAAAARPFSSLDRTKSVDNYEAVLDKFAEIRACAVLRTPTSEACPKAMQAAIDGGFKIVEFTLTTPDCLQHLSDFRTKYDGDVMVGCGTILNTTDAENAVDAGAEFIITPVMLPDGTSSMIHTTSQVCMCCKILFEI